MWGDDEGDAKLIPRQVKPEENILVNALMPGFVKTELSSKVVPDELPGQVLHASSPLLLHDAEVLTQASLLQLGTRWRSPEEVGQDIVQLVNQPADGPRGKLLQEGQLQPW